MHPVSSFLSPGCVGSNLMRYFSLVPAYPPLSICVEHAAMRMYHFPGHLFNSQMLAPIPPFSVAFSLVCLRPTYYFSTTRCVAFRFSALPPSQEHVSLLLLTLLHPHRAPLPPTSCCWHTATKLFRLFITILLLFSPHCHPVTPPPPPP